MHHEGENAFHMTKVTLPGPELPHCCLELQGLHMQHYSSIPGEFKEPYITGYMALTVTTTGQIGSKDSPSRQGVNTQYAQVNKATLCQGRQESYRWKDSSSHTLLHGHMLTAACMVVRVASSHFVSGRKTAHHLELGGLDVKQVCRFDS